jgi:predicted nucleic acid-binding protein
MVENAPGREKILGVFNRARVGEVKLYLVHPVISEVVYVASRIYKVLGFKEHNKLALDLVTWISSFTNIVEIALEAAIRAGELKKELGLALTDCYVLAVAENLGSKALFFKVEEEMKRKINLVKKLPVEFIIEEN